MAHFPPVFVLSSIVWLQDNANRTCVLAARMYVANVYDSAC